MGEQGVIGITGSSGFVGDALTRDLAADGIPVRLFGRQAGQTGSGRTVEALRPTPDLFQGLDSMVHLAGLTSSKVSAQTLAAVNVALAADTLAAAIEAGVRRFVFFSSLGVHGKGGTRPLRPDDAFAPVNAYGRSKVAAERALNHINRDGAIELVVIRPPMIYGPGGKGSFNALFKLVRTGLPLPFGAATAERSFCSLYNVVSAARAALDRPAPPPVLLPADPDDFSTRDLVQTIKAAGGFSSSLVPAPRWAMKLALGALGQSDLAASLFDPLTVDRSHWTDWAWSPPETGRQAVTETTAWLKG